MLNKNTTIYYASSLQEVQTFLKNIAGISIAAGCTEIARRQTGRSLHFPSQVLSVARLPEICSINKTERFIEFGAGITMMELLKLGKKNVPDVLYQAVQGIANPGIRALATLGGNVAAKGHRLSTFAPLLALDARLEVRTAQEILSVPMSRYFSNTGREQPKLPEFISKIRIPTEEWDISFYRRLGRPGLVTGITSSYAFLVKTQKNTMTDIRIAWAGKFFFRNREFENLLIGRSLPLSEKEIVNLMEKADILFDPALFPPSYERQCLLNFLEESLRILT